MDASDDHLADIDRLWDFDDPQTSEQRFLALARRAEVLAEPAYLLEILTQIARAQGLQRRFDDAHHTLDEVEWQLTDDRPRLRIRYLLERGRVYNTAGDRARARTFFLDAYESALAAREDALTVDAAHMLAIATEDDEQLAWNLRALDIARHSPHERARRWLGSLYNNLGWTYHDRGEYQQALDMFEAALAERRRQGQPGPIRIARWAVARALRSLGRYEQALLIQRELLAETSTAGERDGYVYEELGELNLALGREDDARSYFALAHGELSTDPWFAAHEPDRLERIRCLAGLC